MSLPTINTWLLPQLFSPEELTDGIVVIIDILRASSTICTALSHDAERVIPCLEVEQALDHKQQFPEESVLLGGERQGVKISGFDLGNSPREYTLGKVEGKTILFTTTNGTKALLRCQQAQHVLIGSFLNLPTVCDWLREQSNSLHLVCAGTDNAITLEDCLFAGAVASKLLEVDRNEHDDATRLCLKLFQEADHISDGIHQQMLDSQGGRNLSRLGLQQDVHYCSQIGRLDVIPVWHAEENEIRPA